MRFPIIDHHGAKDGVTGSCHQLRMNASSSLLIGCGLFQGNDASIPNDPGADRLAIEFPVDTIKALVATHVHIDHDGRIPYLFAAGFEGPILCSEPSAKLLSIVLEDAFQLCFSRNQAQIEQYIRLVEQAHSAAVPAVVLADQYRRTCRAYPRRLTGIGRGSAHVDEKWVCDWAAGVGKKIRVVPLEKKAKRGLCRNLTVTTGLCRNFQFN